MDYYVSFESAAILWEVPGLDMIIGTDAMEQTVTQVTATTRNKNRRRKGYEIHYSDAEKLPKGAVEKVGGFAVAKPALLFLQMARKLPLKKLALLGLQLCSHPVGEPEKAICKVEEIQAFIDQIHNMKGVQRAREALKHVVNGSASIRESMLRLMLSMGRKDGGYEICDLQFNKLVNISEAASRRLNKQYLFIDLYSASHNIGIEYMSNTYHKATAEADRQRRMVLEEHGYKIFWFTSKDLLDQDAFYRIVKKIAVEMNHQLPETDASFVAENREFFDFLHEHREQRRRLHQQEEVDNEQSHAFQRLKANARKQRVDLKQISRGF